MKKIVPLNEKSYTAPLTKIGWNLQLPIEILVFQVVQKITWDQNDSTAMTKEDRVALFLIYQYTKNNPYTHLYN